MGDYDGRNTAYYEARAEDDSAVIQKLREALQAAQLQLEYLESRWPTETTPPTIAKIERALKDSLHAY